MWSPDANALRGARRRSVRDRSGARAGEAGHVHDRAAVHGRVPRRRPTARRTNLTSGFTHQVSDPVWSAGRVGALLPRRQQQDLRRDDLPLHRCGSDARPVVARGRSPTGADADGRGRRRVGRGRDASRRPVDARRQAVSAPASPISTRSSRASRFSKPELFYFHNADGERLGALLYKPAGLEARRQGAGHHLGLREDDAGHPPLQRPRSDVHQPRLRDADAEREGQGRADRRLVREVRRAGGERGPRRWGSRNGKFGLWGHSFGAYATSNLITRTNIFAAAVSGATPPELFRNWASGRDRDSRNIETGQARMGGSPFELPRALPLAVGLFPPRQGEDAGADPARREGPARSSSAKAR